MWVFRIRLGVLGLARTRFAISPLAEVFSLLELVIRPETVPTSRRAWMLRTQAVLRRGDMPLLRALAVPGYLPDLLTPQPNRPDTDVMAELRLVRSTPAARVRAEMTAMRDGRPEAGLAPRPLAPVVAAALSAGETHLTDLLATELELLWRRVLAADWPAIRAALSADINHRAGILAREGAASLLAGLHPSIGWQDGEIHIESRFSANVSCDDALVLVPSVVSRQPATLIDPCRDDCRPPVICYPADSAMDGGRVDLGTQALLGVTRASLLADLDAARTTTELAARHHLTPSAVSCHLGILHRSGLARRSRVGPRVLYQRTTRADVRLATSTS